MVSFRLDSSNGQSNSSLSLGVSHRLPDDIGDHVLASRPFLNQCGHAVIVYGATANIVFRNSAAAAKVAHVDVHPNPQSDVAVWKCACETAAQLVAEAMRQGQREFSVVFPVQQRSFVVSGSVTQQSSGRPNGAIANISELRSPAQLRGYPADTPAVDQIGRSVIPTAISTRPGESTAVAIEDDEYQQWLTRHAEASRKMKKLSKRESQVAALVSRGMANKSIARELDISVKTIEKHRANAVRKLGVCSTPEMVRIAVTAEAASDAPSGTAFQPPTTDQPVNSRNGGYSARQM